MSENREMAVGCRGYSQDMSSTISDSPTLTRAQRRADLGPRSAPTHLIRVESPIGRLEITSDGTAVTALTIERGGRLPWDALPERSAPVLKTAAKQLEEYFAGKRRDFDLPLSVGGTAFQRAIWSEIDSSSSARSPPTASSA